MIELSHVVKDYGEEPGKKPVINDFSLTIEPGEFVLLTGPSGIGKTTLIKLISRELSPDSGRILFEGRDIAEFSPLELPDYRKKVGIVFQDFRLLSDRNVWQNLELVRHINGLSKKEFEKKASSVLRLTGMELFHKRMPFSTPVFPDKRIIDFLFGKNPMKLDENFERFRRRIIMVS